MMRIETQRLKNKVSKIQGLEVNLTLNLFIFYQFNFLK